MTVNQNNVHGRFPGLSVGGPEKSREIALDVNGGETGQLGQRMINRLAMGAHEHAGPCLGNERFESLSIEPWIPGQALNRGWMERFFGVFGEFRRAVIENAAGTSSYRNEWGRGARAIWMMGDLVPGC